MQVGLPYCFARMFTSIYLFFSISNDIHQTIRIINGWTKKKVIDRNMDLIAKMQVYSIFFYFGFVLSLLSK